MIPLRFYSSIGFKLNSGMIWCIYGGTQAFHETISIDDYQILDVSVSHPLFEMAECSWICRARKLSGNTPA
jgi:hypothetical protein